jgi:hypothetical protein
MVKREIEVGTGTAPGQAKRGRGRPPLNKVKAMADAERIAKWRAKHARRLARKTQYTPRPPTLEELLSLVPDADGFVFRD